MRSTVAQSVGVDISKALSTWRSIPAARSPCSKSGQVHGETLEIGERAVLEGAFVGRPREDHAGRAAHLQRFAPAGRTQAPAVAGPQAGKAELGHRRREIIAAGFGKLEKRGGHDDADRVAATSSRLVLQQPSQRTLSWASSSRRRAGRRGDSGARSGDLPRSRCHPSALPTSWIAAMPGEYRRPPWERRLRFRSYRSSARLPALRRSEVRNPLRSTR